ncbi:HNH endonuclease [Candidatus Pacearchaeota archaeon]|nr:HNH endonuclease [Candidatus Pacearchaeota archaeon]
MPYSNQTDEERFMDRVWMEPNCGCWLWTAAISSSGYGGFRMKGRDFSAHRVSFSLFNGPIPRKLFVLHKCDVKICVNPEHLFLGTHQDNMDDMTNKMRCCGKRSHNSKLNEFQVRVIKRLIGVRGLTYKEIGNIFGVTPGTVGYINTGHIWRHLITGERL